MVEKSERDKRGVFLAGLAGGIIGGFFGFALAELVFVLLNWLTHAP